MADIDDYTWIVMDNEDDLPGWQDWHECVTKITDKLEQAEAMTKKAKNDHNFEFTTDPLELINTGFTLRKFNTLLQLNG